MPPSKASNRARVALVSLGCPKNLVDSEVLLGRLAHESFDIVRDPEEADIAFVNTCGFIDAAREESTGAIDSVMELKNSGRLSGVVVAGCMVKLFRDRLESQFPGVDAFLDVSDYSDAPKAVRGILQGKDVRHLKGGAVKEGETDLGRALLTPEHFAYLRVSEGCNYKCSFCIIPQIRGRHMSKPLEALEDEVRQLTSLGVKELSLIGEDSTMYGRDLPGKVSLVTLLERLSGIDGVEWLRILYTHPLSFEDRLIDVLRDNPKVVPYVDMPLQHIDDGMLKAMRRGTPRAMIEERIAQLRERVPGIALRTTMIVGFPGETEEAFEALLSFLADVKFERLGCFTYSPEETSGAAALEDDVPKEVKQERQQRVMPSAKGDCGVAESFIDRSKGPCHSGRSVCGGSECGAKRGAGVPVLGAYRSGQCGNRLCDSSRWGRRARPDPRSHRHRLRRLRPPRRIGS